MTSELRHRVWRTKEQRTPRSNYGHLSKHIQYRATFFYTGVKVLILLEKRALIGGPDSGNLEVLNFLGGWQSLSDEYEGFITSE
jgi:hypothetical protein